MNTVKRRGIPDDYRKYLADRYAVLGPDNERWLKDDPVLWSCILQPAGPAPKGAKFLPDEIVDSWAAAHDKVWLAKLMGYPDVQFYGHVLKAICWTWNRIQLTDPPPRFRILDNWNILDNYVEYMRWLIVVRDHMRSGRDLRQGLNNVVSDLFRLDSFKGEPCPFNDEEDFPDHDFYYELVDNIATRYYHQPTFSLGQLPPEPEVEEAIARFHAWEIERKRKQTEVKREQRAWNSKQALELGYRDMPHNPDISSLRDPYDWAMQQRIESDTEAKLSAARVTRDASFFEGLANVCGIEGFVGYWVKQPISEVRSRLHRSCDHMKQALDFGLQLHAWQINDQIHKAIAVNHHSLVTAIVNLQGNAWDTQKIKPVNWLVTRIRLVVDMYNSRENDLNALLENERKWVFEEALPPELATELPEMRNFFALLKALVERDAEEFSRALSERTTVRAKYFDGNIAPIALLDVHGLALCRLAKKRNITPHANHVYLPLELLGLR